MPGARSTALGAVAAAVLACASGAAAAPTAPLSQSGRWITDAKGRAVIMHGVNMVYKRPPYHAAATGFGADDARFLRDEGFITVRLGLIHKAVEPQPGAYSDAYLAEVARSVTELRRAGIFTMLDFHQDLFNERYEGEGLADFALNDDGLPPEPRTGFPGNYPAMPALNRSFDHFWANDRPPGDSAPVQDRYAAAWRHVAGRFRRERYVMGYDLFNEPWPGSQWSTCANSEGCPAFDQLLTAFSRRVTARIREVDGRNIVWYEPHVIFNNGAKTSHGDTGPRAGMSFHVYCLAEGGSPGRSPFDPAQSAGCSAFEELPLENADAQAARTGDALMLSEFGATDDLEQIERVVEGAERHMTSWQYWHYCECADPTTSGAGGAQSLVPDPSKPPGGDNVKLDKLAVLARPHPQAVAGTPLRYDFEPQGKSFALEYSTTPVGARLGRGADTQVFVPPRHYPRGYDVVVEGADPVSQPNDSQLWLRTCPGRERVKLSLGPGIGRAFADCRARVRRRAARRRFRLRLSVRPRTVLAGRRTRVRFRATVRIRGRSFPVRRARISIGRRAVRTSSRGSATMRLRLARVGRHRVRASRRGLRTGRATIHVRWR